jgi:hypothetical protein
MHCQCKLTLHYQPIRMVQSFMSYKKSGEKWDNVAENMVVIG